MKLDDASVAARIATYPEDSKEPVMWLAAYLRERCKSSRRVLIEHLKAKGFEVSDNYVYKIFKGLYFTSDGGGKMLGSVDNLLQKINALRAGVQLSQKAGKLAFVETPTWVEFNDYVTRKIAPENVCRFAIVLGPTGSQKTACGKHFRSLKAHNSVILVDAPDKGSLTTLVVDMCRQFGLKISGPLQGRKLAIQETVTDKTTIIFDNVQRLYRPGKGTDQPAFDFIQKLQDDSGCAIVFLVAKLKAGFLLNTKDQEDGYFEQFEGRAGGVDDYLILDDYTPAADLRMFAEAYGLDPDAEDLKYLEQLSRKNGRVRIVHDSLQRGKRLADLQKVDFTVDHVREARGEALK